MFGAIYIGLSGLNAYSRGLQQVSNNVANLNSSGFKASTVSFTDLIGLNGRDGFSLANGGGDSGNGVSINKAQRDFRPGELRQTDRDLDLGVQGNGFLVLLNGEEVLYTRTGSFEVDTNGFIVLVGTKYRLATLDASGDAVSLSVEPLRTHPPSQTTAIKLEGNLSFARAEQTPSTYGISDVKVYDSKGGEHVWQIQFTQRSGEPSEPLGTDWDVKITDKNGRIFGPKILKYNVGGIASSDTNKLVFDDTENGLSVTLDFSNVRSFSGGSVSQVRVSSVDGYKLGALTTMIVNEKGEIELGYSNEQKKQLGPIALADFRNPQALEERNGGLFAETALAQREWMTSEDERVGLVQGRRLEASNVDLAKQFGDLILIQRGFQASSQIISVSNDMIQQLFGIRGQG